MKLEGMEPEFIYLHITNHIPGTGAGPLGGMMLKQTPLLFCEAYELDSVPSLTSKCSYPLHQPIRRCVLMVHYVGKGGCSLSWAWSTFLPRHKEPSQPVLDLAP